MFKKLTLLTNTLLVLFTLSCSNEEQPKEYLGNVPFTREGALDTALVMVYKTTDFCDWRSAQKSIQSSMLEHGIRSLAFYKGLIDTNLVISLNEVENVEKAKAFIDSESMAPLIDVTKDDEGITSLYLDQQLECTKDSEDSIVHLMSFKTVKYHHWENAFLDDYRDDPEHEFAVTSVFKGMNERNQVYILFRVNDPGYVEKMEKNNAFKMKMLAAGVISYPVTFKLVQTEV